MKKSNFSNCDMCPLLDQKMVIGETNSPDDLLNVTLLVLAENPAATEVELNRPLVGKAGQIFRKYFELSKLNTLPHFITNVVLCANLHVNERGRLVTINPPNEAKESCRPNWEMLIKVLQPDYILAMGGTVQKMLGIPGKTISSARGRFFDYPGNITGMEKIPVVFVTYHPSYLGRGTAPKSAFIEYENDMKTLYYKITGIDPKQSEKRVNRDKLKVQDPYYIQFPHWMKTDNISLIDVQKMGKTDHILFSFRKEDGTKMYYVDKTSQYYYYKRDGALGDEPVSVDVSEAELIQGKPPYGCRDAMYEGDMKIENKYALDYFLQRKKPEVLISPIKMYFDIEVYSEGSKIFPDPIKAIRPINAISFKYDQDPINIFVVNPEKLIKNPSKSHHLDYDIVSKFDFNDDRIIRVFEDEKSLLLEFAKVLVKLNPDLLIAWNVDFDMFTIYNRMGKLGIDQNILSPFGIVIDNIRRSGELTIVGLYALDMLATYKKFTENKKEMYKLGFISKLELGEGKVEYEGTLDDLYENDINKFLRYSAQDTNLLHELDDKLGHVDLKNELRKTCHCTWKGTENTTGLLDPLCISYQKIKGKILRNSEHVDSDKKLKGAYVLDPVSGLYSYMTDFDYTSLYPSIIISLNIGPDTYIGKIDKNIAYNYIYNKTLPDNISVIINPMMTSPVYKTMTRQEFEDWLEENDATMSIIGTIFLGHSKKVSFLSEMCSTLLDTRVQFKNKMKEAKRNNDPLYSFYYNKQWAYKILANSIYGVLGTSSFRLFKLDLAMTITQTGKELLRFAGYHLSQYMQNGNTEIDPNFDEKFYKERKYITYGDTDSLYVSMAEYLIDNGYDI